MEPTTTTEQPREVVVAQTGFNPGGLIALVIFIAVLGAVGYWAWKHWQKERKAKQEKAAAPQEELQSPVNLDRLARLIDDVENRAGRAETLVRDIATETFTQVGLIVAMVQKAEDLRKEAEGIDKTLSALANKDMQAFYRAAGSLQDKVLQRMCLSEVHTQEYWDGVEKSLNLEAGLREEWSQKYVTLATRLLGEVRTHKARMIQLTAAIEGSRTCRPLLTASNKILLAESALQISLEAKNTQHLTLAPTFYRAMLDK